MYNHEFEYSFTLHSVGQGFYYSGKIDNFHFIYDCGSEKGFTETLNSELSFYNESINNDNSIGLLVISHFDYDHVSGIENLLNTNTVDTVVIPYIPFAKRIEFSLKHYNSDEWYINFLFKPIEYLNEKNIKRIYVIYGNNGGFDSDIIPVNPELPPDIESLNNEDFNLKYSHTYYNDNKRIKKRIERKDKGYTGEVELFGYSNRFKGDLYSKWKFCFYYLTPNDKIYSGFKTEFNKLKIKTSEDLINILKKKSGRKQVRACYPKDSKNMNNSSLVLYHSPINKYIYRSYYYIEKNGEMTRSFLTNTLYNNILLKNNLDFGQLLTGDLDLNKDSKSFFNHFKDEITSVAIFYIAHHGSIHNWNCEFLEKYSESAFWFVSTGFKNKFGHPHLPVVNRIINARKNLGWSNEYNRLKINGHIFWNSHFENVNKSKIFNEEFNEYPIRIEKQIDSAGFKRIICEMW